MAVVATQQLLEPRELFKNWFVAKFFKRANPGLFLFISVLFNNNFTGKLWTSEGIRTRIVRIEIEHADHLTTARLWHSWLNGGFWSRYLRTKASYIWTFFFWLRLNKKIEEKRAWTTEWNSLDLFFRVNLIYFRISTSLKMFIGPWTLSI